MRRTGTPWKIGTSVTLLLAVIACSDEVTSPNVHVTHGTVTQSDRSDGISEHFTLIARIGVSLDFTGPFKPGVPFGIRATARGIRRSGDAAFEIVALDGGASASQAQTSLASWSGLLAEGASAGAATTATFPEAGYYRIVVRSEGAPPSEARPPSRDTVVATQATKTYWVLVDENGGRVTRELDPAVTRMVGRAPAFGFTGPFRVVTPAVVNPTITNRGPIAGAYADRATSGAVASVASCGSIGVYCGRVTYRALDQKGVPLAPVANAQLTGVCWQDVTRRYGNSFHGFFTSSDGSFRIDCNEWGWSEGGMSLAPPMLTSASATVIGLARDSVYYGPSASATIDYRLSNDDVGRAWELLNQYVPTVPARFGGYSRGPVLVNSEGEAAGTSCDSKYTRTNDAITLLGNCVFGNFGTFIVMHEYGHAYHYKALEAWRTNPTCEKHAMDTGYSLQCAFVEGFADFFSAWVLQDRIPPNGYDYSNNLFETNQFRVHGDGSKIEGAVAGFFLDIVDGPADTDNVGGDDDSVTWPGSYVAELIRNCAPGSETELDGIDEFIYCAEDNDVAPRLANPYNSWRTYSHETEGAIKPAGWSASKVRALWRHNLFNEGANP